MNKWKTVYTERAERDLRDIFEYIAFVLLEPMTAKRQTLRITDAVKKLADMPMMYHLYGEEPWRSKGLRVMPVDKYIVFYIPIEDIKTAAVIRIMYGGRNVADQLSESDIKL